MKKVALLFIVLLGFIAANAQFKQLAEGPVFEEPQEGAAKILQMKNGNTILLTTNEKTGIQTRIYNKAHEEIAVTSIEPSFAKDIGYFNAAFEINGDLILMVRYAILKVPFLYRLIIDGKSGKLKDEKQIGQLNKVDIGQKFAMVYGHVPFSSFYVKKDPYSDNYAVVIFNSFAPDRNKRIELIVYNAENKELSRSYYTSPEEKYKYLEYVDMSVIGTDKVCVVAYGYNTENSGGKESELLLASLDKGATSFDFTDLDFSKDLSIQNGITRYDPVTKMLMMVLAAKVKSTARETDYIPYLVTVDPYKKRMLKSDPVTLPDSIASLDFAGLPQNLFVNDDGGFTIVYEEITRRTYSNGSSSYTNTELGRLAVVNYNKLGIITNDYFIRKSHILVSSLAYPFYHADRQDAGQVLSKGNQYKSFAYLNGKSQSFILFNDTERNNDKQEDGKLVSVLGVGASDGFYYTLTGAAMTPKRDYVFGNPESKKDHNLALFTVSDYDRSNNIYTTLKLEREGRKKGVKVVWLQP